MSNEQHIIKVRNKANITRAFQTLCPDKDGFHSDKFAVTTYSGIAECRLRLDTSKSPKLSLKTQIGEPSHISYHVSTKGSTPVSVLSADIATNDTYEGLGLGGALFSLTNAVIELLITEERRFQDRGIIGVIDDRAHPANAHAENNRKLWSSHWAQQLGYTRVADLNVKDYPKGFEDFFSSLVSGNGWFNRYRS